MRRPTLGDSGFWFSFGLNLVMNWEGALLVVILAAAHVLAGIPLWVLWVELGLWIGGIFAVTLIMSVLARGADPSPSGTGTQGNTTVRYASRGDGQDFRWANPSQEVRQDLDSHGSD